MQPQTIVRFMCLSLLGVGISGCATSRVTRDLVTIRDDDELFAATRASLSLVECGPVDCGDPCPRTGDTVWLCGIVWKEGQSLVSVARFSTLSLVPTAVDLDGPPDAIGTVRCNRMLPNGGESDLDVSELTSHASWGMFHNADRLRSAAKRGVRLDRVRLKLHSTFGASVNELALTLLPDELRKSWALATLDVLSLVQLGLAMPRVALAISEIMHGPDPTRVVVNLGVSVELDLDWRSTEPEPVQPSWWTGNPLPGLRVPYALRVNGVTAVQGTILAVQNVPPFQTCGGLISVDGIVPESPNNRFRIELIAAQRGPAEPESQLSRP